MRRTQELNQSYVSVKQSNIKQNSLEILDILNLPLKERMFQEINRLRDLTKGMPLFDSLKKSGQPDIHMQLCQEFGTKSFRENEVIMNVGQHFKQFHMILSGQVGVYVRQKRKDQVQKEEQLYLVKVLNQGDCFGDVSMVYNQASLVSFVCLQETYTATIDYKIFKVLLDQFFLIRMTFQINFLREIPLFWDWGENDLRVLYQVYSRQKLTKEEPVYLQGESTQFIYIVKEGKFRIYKHFDELRVRKFYDKEFRQVLDQDKHHTKSIREFQDQKNIDIGTIEKNELFGEEDILTKRDRKYSVVCDTDYGELFVLTKSAMNSLVMNNDKSKNYILARFKNKQGSFSKRLDNVAQYVSSVKIDVIEKNQDQLRFSEDFLQTRNSKIMNQQSMIQSMKTLSKLSDSKYQTIKKSSVFKNSARLNLPKLNGSSQNMTFYQQNSNNQIDSKSNFATSRGLYGYQNNLEDKNNLVINRTTVNLKSINNLNSTDSLVNTQYFTNKSQIGNNQNAGISRAESIQDKRRKNYMQKYYDQFKFNVVNKNYSDRIIEQCQDLTQEYSNNKMYAKGAFNNKLGQIGYRCLGIDDRIDVEQEYLKTKLKIQQEFDPDYKIKNLNKSITVRSDVNIEQNQLPEYENMD